MIGERIVAEARTWLGTPFHGQQSCKQGGCDCSGLLVGVARELDLPAAQSPYARIADYQNVDTRLLRQGFEDCMDLIAKHSEWMRSLAEPGDVLLLKLWGKPQHTAIYCGETDRTGRKRLGGCMIHAMPECFSRVTETPMGRIWWSQCDSIWRWRD